MSNKCLPDNLKGKPHDDWVSFVSWVPRSWTARCGWAWPQPPKLLIGNSGWDLKDYHRFGHHDYEFFKLIRHVLPIPKPGHFMISAVLFLKFIPLPMMAWSFKAGGWISLGVVRWDDVDKYYDVLRIRASGTRGRIALILIGLGLAALGYFLF